MSNKLTIEGMQTLASKRGGKCLSKKYINTDTKLKWRCEKGHLWESTAYHIKNRGQWCPTCGHIDTANKLRGNIEQMQKLATKQEGNCLSTLYINTVSKLKWRCKEGHQWETTPANVKRGSWCPECVGVTPLSIEEMQELAVKRGGMCLSKKYITDLHPTPV